jgi:hypothetical protein
MNKNKHLLLWSSLGVLALLVAAAVQENFLKDWRQIQASARADGGPIDVRLRQIVVPKLKVTDRCVSCHVGMVPGEQGLSGSPLAAAHSRLVHDPGEFGCTVCHGGQGRATDKADAHGDVHFWPQPMIPVQYASAGCGSCHTHIRVPNQAQLRRGKVWWNVTIASPVTASTDGEERCGRTARAGWKVRICRKSARPAWIRIGTQSIWPRTKPPRTGRGRRRSGRSAKRTGKRLPST